MITKRDRYRYSTMIDRRLYWPVLKDMFGVNDYSAFFVYKDIGQCIVVLWNVLYNPKTKWTSFSIDWCTSLNLRTIYTVPKKETSGF